MPRPGNDSKRGKRDQGTVKKRAGNRAHEDEHGEGGTEVECVPAGKPETKKRQKGKKRIPALGEKKNAKNFQKEPLGSLRSTKPVRPSPRSKAGKEVCESPVRKSCVVRGELIADFLSQAG